MYIYIIRQYITYVIYHYQSIITCQHIDLVMVVIAIAYMVAYIGSMCLYYVLYSCIQYFEILKQITEFISIYKLNI